mgnify:FL=1|tara:strand:- start:18 stop:554 length:537 start_codon:yes stop_codon:yes gene_type:complete
MFENFDYSQFKNMPPPKDGSLKSLSEIKDLQNIPMDKGFVKKRDDIYGSFKELADKKNITLDKKEINNLSDSSASVILKLKKYYNRPRPREQAKQYGLQLENIELSSMKTPSYPSGHSAQGILIGNYLADKYKDQDFKKIGNEISDARNVARAHYKSDSDMGKKLGESMYNYITNGKR